MKRNSIILIFIANFIFLTLSLEAKTVTERQAIIDTNDAIRAAFVAQDIPAILSYHHPKVEKVFAWNDYQKGHGDMRNALQGIFTNFVLEFQGSSSEMDSLEIFDNTAIMIAPFTIHGKPKTEGMDPFVFSGRTMILYVKSDASSTGWQTIREMIVPAQ